MGKVKKKGVIKHMKLEGGFYGFVDDAGQQWELLDLPKSAQVDQKTCTLELKPIDAETIAMWGQPAKVVRVLE